MTAEVRRAVWWVGEEKGRKSATQASAISMDQRVRREHVRGRLKRIQNFPEGGAVGERLTLCDHRTAMAFVRRNVFRFLPLTLRYDSAVPVANSRPVFARVVRGLQSQGDGSGR